MEIDETPPPPLTPRQHRVSMSTNVALSICLGLAVLLMVNYLAIRHHYRTDLAGKNFYTLSGKSTRILQSLSTNVEVIVFHKSEQTGMEDVRKVLEEYKEIARTTPSFGLTVTYIDASKDIMRSRKLIKEFNLSRSGIIIARTAGRHVKFDIDHLMTFDYTQVLAGGRKQKLDFRGEQLITSAIYNITHHKTPIVHFLVGHGERDTKSIDGWKGLSKLRSIIGRDNVDVRQLDLSQVDAVPEDCSALIVVGPTARIPQKEIAAIDRYLERSGRALFMIDSGERTGLVRLLAKWSVQLNDDVVIGTGLSQSEVIVTKYEDHQITHSLRNTHSVFGFPRSLRTLDFPLGPNRDATHKPQVTVLIRSDKGEWGETDLNTDPTVFDADVDTPGPVAIAVAVERGVTKGLDAQIHPTRLVVVGDSECIHNNSINKGLDAKEFFMNSLNWLLERDEMIAVAAKPFGEPKLMMSRDQYEKIDLALTIVLPGFVLFLGLIVWHQRKH